MRAYPEEIQERAIKLHHPTDGWVWLTPLQVISMKFLGDIFNLTTDGERNAISRAKWLQKHIAKQKAKTT